MASKTPLFVYGTLMSAEIMQKVCGERFSKQSASLQGFQRYPFNRQLVPGIVPDSRGAVEGVLYWDLPFSIFGQLDDYEGSWYKRMPVQVELSDGTRVAAQAYVVKPQHRFRLASREWSFKTFEEQDKQYYLERL